MKFGGVVFEIREQRDRHTDKLIAVRRTDVGGEAIKYPRHAVSLTGIPEYSH